FWPPPLPTPPGAGAAAVPPYTPFSTRMEKAILRPAPPYGAKPMNQACDGPSASSAAPVLPATATLAAPRRPGPPLPPADRREADDPGVRWPLGQLRRTGLAGHRDARRTAPSGAARHHLPHEAAQRSGLIGRQDDGGGGHPPPGLFCP